MIVMNASVPKKIAATKLLRKLTLSSSLQVGHALIDEDHRRLFEMINGIIDTIENDGNPRKKYSQFMRALKSHYRREENLLRETGYPRTDEHAAYHEARLKEAEKLERHLGEDDGISERDFAEELVAFVLEDILKGDLKFKSFLVEKRLNEEK